MGDFIKELEIGEIHLRDRWQFELKSEFFPLPQLKQNKYTQEFYLFIPNALQINRNTYSKSQFYKDQTNLIRYKTPVFTFQELLDKQNKKSPLTRIWSLKGESQTEEIRDLIEDELKLFGNIVRSALRKKIGELIKQLRHPDVNKLNQDMSEFCEEFKQLHKSFSNCKQDYRLNWPDGTLQIHFHYINDFISNSINYYCMGFLEHVRKSPISNLDQVDQALCDLISHEKRNREKTHQEPRKIKEDPIKKEYILYRSGLLKKFVLDALLLETKRASIDTRLRNIIGSIAAGVAMAFFFILFVWQGRVFIINSLPFILATVILYIIKDRIKEGFKRVSYKQALKWFPDYATHIQSPEGNFHIGEMVESFAFVHESEIPKEISNIRNREFHAVLERFKRPEQIIFYKRIINISKPPTPERARRYGLNFIFRFSIGQFVQKADDPIHSYVTLDPDALELIRTNLPKVYHLNIILKNTYTQKDLTKKVELKKFRLILDKNGIRRIEHVPHMSNVC